VIIGGYVRPWRHQTHLAPRVVFASPPWEPAQGTYCHHKHRRRHRKRCRHTQSHIEFVCVFVCVSVSLLACVSEAHRHTYKHAHKLKHAYTTQILAKQSCHVCAWHVFTVDIWSLVLRSDVTWKKSAPRQKVASRAPLSTCHHPINTHTNTPHGYVHAHAFTQKHSHVNTKTHTSAHPIVSIQTPYS